MTLANQSNLNASIVSRKSHKVWTQTTSIPKSINRLDTCMRCSNKSATKVQLPCVVMHLLYHIQQFQLKSSPDVSCNRSMHPFTNFLLYCFLERESSLNEWWHPFEESLSSLGLGELCSKIYRIFYYRIPKILLIILKNFTYFSQKLSSMFHIAKATSTDYC